jgi:hypothetical protein
MQEFFDCFEAYICQEYDIQDVEELQNESYSQAKLIDGIYDFVDMKYDKFYYRCYMIDFHTFYLDKVFNEVNSFDDLFRKAMVDLLKNYVYSYYISKWESDDE